MKVKILIGALLFLIAVNLATIGSYVYLRFTHNQPHPLLRREWVAHPPFRGRRGPGFYLNRAQRKQLMKLLQSFHRETMPERRQIRIIERKTFQLMQKDPVPMDSVEKNLKDIASIRYKISIHIIKKMMAAKSYLTPKQQHEFYNAIMRAQAERNGNVPPQGPPPQNP